MKILVYTLSCLIALACSCTDDISIGKSMGRWDDCDVESMMENRAGGLEYIEVTMNDVIGKDTAGVWDRAGELKARVDSAGLKVWSVHMPYSRKWDISIEDEAKRADVVSFMKDIIRVAGVFKPQCLVIHPSFEPIAPDERAARLACSRASVGEPSELAAARDLLTGETVLKKSFIDADSLAFRNADWQITEIGKGAQAMYAQVPMFFSTQSICAIKYPASEFKTEILHRPGNKAGKPSVLGKEIGASAAVNAGYFHVKPRIPSVYFRIGEEVYGHTHPTEIYRVDGVVGFKDKDGKQMVIEYSDTTQYEAVSGDWHTVMASGPMLMVDGDIVVPLLKGDEADGANVEAMKAEQKSGSKVRTHYSSAQFYDKRHPRAAVGTDDKGNIYYVVIDGRFKGQGDGASIYETAYICKMLGMTDAINLDGGGSTTLWSEVTGVINHPYDNKIWDHEGERAVPNLIVAY